MSTHPSPSPTQPPLPSDTPVDLATESVAGEEDPGAALEDLLPAAPSSPTPPPKAPSR